MSFIITLLVVGFLLVVCLEIIDWLLDHCIDDEDDETDDWYK